MDMATQLWTENLTAPVASRTRPSSSSMSWTFGSLLWVRAASPCVGDVASDRAARNSLSRSSAAGGSWL